MSVTKTRAQPLENILARMQSSELIGLDGVLDVLPQPLKRLHAGKRILVVDDEEYAAGRLKREFSKVYDHVDIAYGGEEALRLMKDAASRGESYDAVVTDMYMQKVRSDGSVEGLNGDGMLRQAAVEGLVDRTAVVVYTRSVADDISNPMFDGIRSAENLDRVRAIADERDPDHEGFGFTKINKYRRPLIEVMYAVDAMMAKAQVQEPDKLNSFLSQYEPTKLKTTPREDTVIKLDELVGDVYLALKAVEDKVRRDHPDYDQVEEVWKKIADEVEATGRHPEGWEDPYHLLTFKRNAEKFFGRYMGTWHDGVRLDSDYIRSLPGNALHEASGGARTIVFAGEHLGYSDLIDVGLQYGKYITHYYHQLVHEESKSKVSLNDIADRFKESAVNQTVNVTAEPGLCIEGDPDFFYVSVLDELAYNARKYRHPERESVVDLTMGLVDTASLSAGEREKFAGESKVVEVRFKDNGAGIPPENLGKIFEPGFTTGDSALGGMGLSLLKKAVEVDFGGTVAVSSTVGEGTEYTMHFRKTARPAEDEEATLSEATIHMISSLEKDRKKKN